MKTLHTILTSAILLGSCTTFASTESVFITFTNKTSGQQAFAQLAFDDMATDAYDPSYDEPLISPPTITQHNIYTLSTDITKLTINTMGDLVATKTIQVYTDILAADSFTVNITSLALSTGSTAIITDNETGEDFTVTQGLAFTVYMDIALFYARFNITITPGPSLGISSPWETPQVFVPTIVPGGNLNTYRLEMEEDNRGPINITAIDLSGNLIHTEVLETRGSGATFHLPLSPGLYIITVTTGTTAFSDKIWVN